MPAEQPSFVNQLREMWTRLQWSQRFTIIGFSLMGLVCIGALAYFMNRMEYLPLFKDLNPEDAKAIGAKLTGQKKDWIIEGSTILVKAPRTEVDKLFIDIAGSGLGASGKIGLEIFDKNQFGMTDFTEQVNLQRGLQGELARTISSLSEISRAQVHIVLPKDSVFEENKEESKASVVLFIKKGMEVSKQNIAGIRGLLSGAVPGLHPHNVSIVDAEGKFLSQAVESGDAGRSEMEAGMREQLEREMSGKVTSILEPVVGKGKVHANASIDLDFNTTEQTEETFNPNPPVIMSQQKSEERAGRSSVPSGVPGIQSNANPQTSQNAGNGPERVRQSETTNYEVNKVVRHTVQPKGTIVRRLSVAVILDHKPTYTKTKDGKTVVGAEPRSQKDLDSYRELVLAAVGFNQQRGDVVTITNVPFYSEYKPEEPQVAVPLYIKWQPILLPAMKYVAFLALFILAYIIFVRPIRKRVFQTMAAAAIGPGVNVEMQLPAYEEGEVPALTAGRQAEELASAEKTGNAGGLRAAESHYPEAIVPLEANDEQIERELMKEANMVDLGNRKYAAIKKKVIEKAKSDPEMVSQLLRTLLREKV
jgi:flagellar M-ring protein FliF